MMLFFIIGFIYALLISTGMGGGVLIVPYLMQFCSFGIDQAKLLMLLLYVPASVIITFLNIRRGVFKLNMLSFFIMATAGTLGVIVGKYLSGLMNDQSMKNAYALFIILLGSLQLLQLTVKRNN